MMIDSFGAIETVETTILDSQIESAYLESLKQNSTLPLIKQELHCKIQFRRLSQGEEELILQPRKPREYELTKEEVNKRNARLQQNRASAHKSRAKSRAKEQTLKRTVDGLSRKIPELQKEKKLLLSEKRKMEKKLSEHLPLCRDVNLANETRVKLETNVRCIEIQ